MDNQLQLGIKLLALLCCLPGCATLQFSWDKDKFAKASAQNPVVQMVCLWEQAEGRDPDGIPCRGFAGQILFLANRNAAPVEVEGDIRIYLFDNVGTVEEQSKPLRQYDFTHEAWKIHLTKSPMGPAYSVFVPYTRRGQQNAQCSLRVRLTPKNGPVIFSELSTMPLRGPSSVPETTIISDIPTEDDRVQAEVQQTLSRALQKSKTIPLNISQNGGLSIAQKFESQPVVPQPAAPTATDDRLARMEKLLEHVLTEKAQSSSAPPARSEIQQAKFESLSPEKNTEAPRRFKLDRSEKDE